MTVHCGADEVMMPRETVEEISESCTSIAE